MARASLVTPVWRPKTNVCLDDGVGLGKALVGIAGVQSSLEGEIVAKPGMDHRRRGIERRFRIRHGGKHVVVDAHESAGIFRLRATACDDRTHRLALPARAFDGDGMLRRRFYALEMAQHADPRRNHFRKFCAGDDRDDARRLLRFGAVNVFDPRVRM